MLMTPAAASPPAQRFEKVWDEDTVLPMPAQSGSRAEIGAGHLWSRNWTSTTSMTSPSSPDHALKTGGASTEGFFFRS